MARFHGFESSVLSNSFLSLEYLTQAGPRLVSLSLPRGENLLGEFPDVDWQVNGERYQMLGGHRVWAAPERPGISYQPDSTGLQATERDASVDLAWEPAGEGFAHSLTISLASDQAAVHLEHTVTNRFRRTVEAGTWGVTVLPLGGEAYLPAPATGSGFLPDRQIVLWPYSHVDDPRMALSHSGIRITGMAVLPALKVGTFSCRGICAYMRAGTLLLKRFNVASGIQPDLGCNVEVYCADKYLELETLGPLVDLAPGDATSINETWELYSGATAQKVLAEIFPALTL